MAEVGETMAASSGGEGGVEAPHRLERKWTFWFDNQSKPKQGAAWGSALRKVYTFDTVEEFWWYGTGFPATICVYSICFGFCGSAGPITFLPFLIINSHGGEEVWRWFMC